jgi:hypothetical protein
MTNAQAAAKAKKRWGASFYIRADESFSSPERREKAQTTVREANERIKHIDDEIRRRLDELDWYRELISEKRNLRKTVAKTEGHAFYYRFSVGTQNGISGVGIFNTILGDGDTWEEAFAKADTRQ